jgi:cell fate (sporulation/competence/biofilm development) regulator YmcA (YheA/YmcA/DUF963 family)
MSAFFQRLSTALLFCLAVKVARAAEPPAFGYAIICDDPAIAKRLGAGIEERFTRLHIQLRDRFPTAKLFIYAARDINDTRNTEGVSVAIAHVSNMQPAKLALEHIERKEALPEMLQTMLREEGMLMHLNVAHMTTSSDAQVNQLLDKVVTTFVQKYTDADPSTAPTGQP